MKNIISAVLMIVFVIGGATAADFMKGGSETVTADAKDTKKGADKGKKGKADKKGKDKKDKDKKSKKDKKGEDDYGSQSKSGSSTYMKFGRQFVVPVIDSGKVQALVMLDINLELASSASEEVYTMEPKIRDALMRALLGLSNDGIFDDQLTDPENYDIMRKKLLRAAKEVIKDSVKDVLILEIARQDQ